MVLLSLIAVFVAIGKKRYNFLPITCIAFLYGFSNFIISFGILSSTPVYNVCNGLSIPLVSALLITTVWMFIKQDDKQKRNALPIILCSGIILVRIIKIAMFFIDSVYTIASGDATREMFNGLLTVVTVLDVIHLLLACAMMINVIILMNRMKTESVS